MLKSIGLQLGFRTDPINCLNRGGEYENEETHTSTVRVSLYALSFIEGFLVNLRY